MSSFEYGFLIVSLIILVTGCFILKEQNRRLIERLSKLRRNRYRGNPPIIEEKGNPPRINPALRNPPNGGEKPNE